MEAFCASIPDNYSVVVPEWLTPFTLQREKKESFKTKRRVKHFSGYKYSHPNHKEKHVKLLYYQQFYRKRCTSHFTFFLKISPIPH
jgi:hypothetical protein